MLFPMPKKRVLPDSLGWKIVPVIFEVPVEGWLAGPVVPVATHWHKARQCSLPCRSIISSGKLVCGCEETKLVPRNIGYCPIITRAREKWVIVLSETVMEDMLLRKVGTPLKFTRPKAPKKPLFVSKLSEEHLGLELTKKMRQISGHPIEEYLCHVWQDKEITEHFGFTFYPAIGLTEDGRKKKKKEPPREHEPDIGPPVFKDEAA